MKLLTKEIIRKLPALYSQDCKGLKAKAIVKFFDPTGSWTWYASEFDGKDTFFGLVCGFEKELGYFSLSELEHAKDNMRGISSLPIERDLYFKSTELNNLYNK